MELQFSQNDPINTVLRAPDGQLLYKMETPGTDLLLPGKTTTISKVISSEACHATSAIEMQDRFIEVASIEWHLKDSSTLRYDGKQVDIQEFMPAVGPMSLVGR